MAEIRLTDVRKSFGAVEAIKCVTLDIRSGEFMVFVGPSGCGKSTLLRLIAGLEDVTSGTLTFDGEVVNGVAPSKRGVAMVFQSYALYPHMNVYDNMAFGIRLSGSNSRDEVDRRVRRAAEMLQIGNLLERLPKQLSGGQRQRVAIGRAITRDPRVFLFDEPLSNLDAALRVAMRFEIAKLHDKMEDVTMIYVTHDQVEAMTLADRISVLRDGLVEQVGAPIELYEKPQSLFVAGFIGSPRMNFLNGRFASKFNAHTLGVRAEHIDVRPSDGEWTGRVVHCEKLGADSYVYVDIGTAQPLIVRESGVTTRRTGDVLHLAPLEGHIHRFDADGKPVAG
jgi:multiple sugar transport system ATP-binding protein